MTKILDVFSKVAKEEDVVFADFTGNLDLAKVSQHHCHHQILWESTHIRSVASSDDQATVQAKLHVTRTRGLGTSCGYVLADVAGGTDDLRLADVVIAQEDDLERIADIFVVVDNITNLVDKMDDCLGHPVSWRGLTTKDGHAGNELLPLLWRHGLDLNVTVDDTENVQLLALVLVNTLDLNIEKSSWVNRNTVVLLDMLCKSYLVGILDRAELLSELFVINVSLELVKQSQVLEELVAPKLRRNQCRELGVSLVKPSAGCDAVRHICELVGPVDLHKIFENSSLDQVGVQLCHTVDLV